MPVDRSLAMQAFKERAMRGGGGGMPQQAPQGNPMQAATKQLQQSQPDEAMIIIKALINRLRAISEKENPKPQSAPAPQAAPVM